MMDDGGFGQVDLGESVLSSAAQRSADSGRMVGQRKIPWTGRFLWKVNGWLASGYFFWAYCAVKKLYRSKYVRLLLDAAVLIIFPYF